MPKSANLSRRTEQRQPTQNRKWYIIALKKESITRAIYSRPYHLRERSLAHRLLLTPPLDYQSGQVNSFSPGARRFARLV